MKSILMLGFLLPFIPMVLMGGLVFYQFDVAYKRRVQGHLTDAVRNGGRHIDRFLADKAAGLQFIAASFGYEKLSETGAMADILRNLRARKDPAFASLCLLDGRGKEIAAAGPEVRFSSHPGEPDWLVHVLNRGVLIRDMTLNPRGISQAMVAVRGGTAEAPWVLMSVLDGGAMKNMLEALRVENEGPAWAFPSATGSSSGWGEAFA